MTSDNLILLAGTGTRWLQLFVSLSLLIVLHEFGHFWFAKKFKMRVEKFYLFFDFLFPISSLLNFSLFKKKVGDTEYGIGWFPLGGYVKIAGMVDESMDKEQLAQAPQPWEYRAKPAWQRLLTMLGGIIVNVLVAIIIHFAVLAIWGEPYLPTKNITYGIMTDSVGKSLGFQDGDQITGVNGKPLTRWNQVKSAIVYDAAREINFTRNGAPMSVKITDQTAFDIQNQKISLFEVRFPATIGDVNKKTEAASMGLKVGDSIISINGEPVLYLDEVSPKVMASKNKPVTMWVGRKINNQMQQVKLAGNVDSTGKLGFALDGDYKAHFKYDTIHYSIGGAAARSFSYTWETIAKYGQGLAKLFDRRTDVNKNLGGIGSFSKIFPTDFDMYSFLMLTALISVILAVMNLLPIPGLDGGYVIFLLYEMITRRKVSEKVMEVATSIGLILLLGLMLYANGLDIMRWWTGK